MGSRNSINHAPSSALLDPGAPIPPDSMYLKVFVGPFAPYETCGPDDAGTTEELGGFPARRIVSFRAPSATWDAVIVYAITPDHCYAVDAVFSLEGPYEGIFNQIVDSFRVGAESDVLRVGDGRTRGWSWCSPDRAKQNGDEAPGASAAAPSS